MYNTHTHTHTHPVRSRLPTPLNHRLTNYTKKKKTSTDFSLPPSSFTCHLFPTNFDNFFLLFLLFQNILIRLTAAQQIEPFAYHVLSQSKHWKLHLLLTLKKKNHGDSDQPVRKGRNIINLHKFHTKIIVTPSFFPLLHATTTICHRDRRDASLLFQRQSCFAIHTTRAIKVSTRIYSYKTSVKSAW